MCVPQRDEMTCLDITTTVILHQRRGSVGGCSVRPACVEWVKMKQYQLEDVYDIMEGIFPVANMSPTGREDKTEAYKSKAF